MNSNAEGPRFSPGDVIEWEAVNGTPRGVVLEYDGFGLGYMIARLANGRRMLVHENSARPASLTTGGITMLT